MNAPVEPARGDPGGVTLLEVMIWTAILAMLSSPVVMAFLASTRGMAETGTVGTVQERARVLLNRLERDVRTAIRETIQVDRGGKRLRFTQPLGFTETGVRPGSTVAYELSLAPGEALNGADDNGDGLVDEAQLVRRCPETDYGVVLSLTLHLESSGFVWDGDGVRLAVSSLGRLPSSGAILTITRSKTVNPRN